MLILFRLATQKKELTGNPGSGETVIRMSVKEEVKKERVRNSDVSAVLEYPVRHNRSINVPKLFSRSLSIFLSEECCVHRSFKVFTIATNSPSGFFNMLTVHINGKINKNF